MPPSPGGTRPCRCTVNCDARSRGQRLRPAAGSENSRPSTRPASVPCARAAARTTSAVAADDRVVKARRDDRPADAGEHVAHDLAHHRAQVDRPRRRPIDPCRSRTALVRPVRRPRSTPARSALRSASPAARARASRCRRSSGRRRAPAASGSLRGDHLAHDAEIARRHGREQRQRVERRLPVERVVEQRQRDAPRMADGRVGAGQRNRRGTSPRARTRRIARPAPRRPTRCRRCHSRCRRRRRR